MLRARRATAVIATTIVLATVAACESGAGADAGADAGGGSLLGSQLKVSLDLTGATGLKGQQTAIAPTNNGTLLSSCAEYAKGSTREDGTYYVGAGILDGPVAGQDVTLEMWIEDYTGPGHYPKDQLVGPGNKPSIAVNGTVYATWPESTASEVTTDGDGGGTWTFRKLAATGPGGVPGKAITGTVRWTCRNP